MVVRVDEGALPLVPKEDERDGKRREMGGKEDKGRRLANARTENCSAPLSLGSKISLGRNATLYVLGAMPCTPTCFPYSLRCFSSTGPSGSRRVSSARPRVETKGLVHAALNHVLHYRRHSHHKATHDTPAVVPSHQASQRKSPHPLFLASAPTEPHSTQLNLGSIHSCCNAE